MGEYGRVRILYWGRGQTFITKKEKLVEIRHINF
jgi:hypothetical protein